MRLQISETAETAKIKLYKSVGEESISLEIKSEESGEVAAVLLTKAEAQQIIDGLKELL